MCASVVTGGYTPPVLELGEHIFDTVALAVELFIVGWLHLSIVAARDAGLDPPVLEGVAIPIAVVAAISVSVRREPPCWDESGL